MREKNASFENPQTEDSEAGITRRKALELTVGGSAAVFAHAVAPQFMKPEEQHVPEETLHSIELKEDKPNFQERGPQKYAMGSLAGRKVNDLFAYYLGVPKKSTVPETLEIDFEKVVNVLWEKKVERVTEKKADWAENTRMAKKVFGEMYAKREQRSTPLSLEDLIRAAGEIVTDVNEHIDWEGLYAIDSPGAEFQGLQAEDVQLIRKMAGRINGTMLIAYSMTELMPSLQDHEMNAEMYKFLLENAGPEFLGSIPALSDNYLSVGMFQFTSYAVFDYNGEKRGASIINDLLPKEKRIKGSVVKLLTQEQQIRAAQLFAIENLTRLVLSIRSDADKARMSQRFERLTRRADTLSTGFLQFIASAHHDPGEARKAFKSWIDDDFQGSHAERANERVEQYIRKSNGNYHYLRKLLQ